MARAKKQYGTKERQKLHEAALERRRQRNREKRTLEMASKAAEGQADFAALVEAEKQRMEDVAATRARKGGEKSPKSITAARENLSLAFDLMGGVPALVVWGRQNPTEFYRIWARLIPKEVAEAQNNLPLEDLLSKLSERAEMSVLEAAVAIGEETLDAAREVVWAEDGTETLQ